MAYPFALPLKRNMARRKKLISDIILFAGTIAPETCAVEWMIQSGAVSPSCYQQAVADMDNIRAEVWLLVYNLLGFIESGKFVPISRQ